MTKIVRDVQPPEPKKSTFSECPRCSNAVSGFQLDAEASDDVIITLRPCGCLSHSCDNHHSQFLQLVKVSGSLY